MSGYCSRTRPMSANSLSDNGASPDRAALAMFSIICYIVLMPP